MYGPGHWEASLQGGGQELLLLALLVTQEAPLPGVRVCWCWCWCCGWTQGEAVSAAPGPLEAATLGWGLTAVRRHHRSPPPPPAPAYHQYPVGNITRATPAAPAHPTWHRVSRTRTSRDNLSTYIIIFYFYPT